MHDAALVNQVAAEADVIVVSIRFAPGGSGDGVKLLDAFPALTRAAAANGARLGVVGGAASLLVAEGGPRLIDTPGVSRRVQARGGQRRQYPRRASRRHHRGGLVLRLARRRSSVPTSPASPRGDYRVGGDVLLPDEAGKSDISGRDYALAFVDEIDQPKHHRTRFTVAY